MLIPLHQLWKELTLVIKIYIVNLKVKYHKAYLWCLIYYSFYLWEIVILQDIMEYYLKFDLLGFFYYCTYYICSLSREQIYHYFLKKNMQIFSHQQ